jgi:hypothetical protein
MMAGDFMDPIKEKIDEILNDTKRLVSEKNFERAIINLEKILAIYPEHKEALYILSKIKDKEIITKVEEPNVFIEDNLWGAAVSSIYYIDGMEIAKIVDKGNSKITVPIGKHELLIQAKMYGEFRQQFEIKNGNSKVRIRTYYTKMGFRFSAEISASD